MEFDCSAILRSCLDHSDYQRIMSPFSAWIPIKRYSEEPAILDSLCWNLWTSYAGQWSLYGGMRTIPENDSQLGGVFTKVIATISLLAYTQVSIQAVFSYNPACSRFLSIAAVLCGDLTRGHYCASTIP